MGGGTRRIWRTCQFSTMQLSGMIRERASESFQSKRYDIPETLSRFERFPIVTAVCFDESVKVCLDFIRAAFEYGFNWWLGTFKDVVFLVDSIAWAARSEQTELSKPSTCNTCVKQSGNLQSQKTCLLCDLFNGIMHVPTQSLPCYTHSEPFSPSNQNPIT